MGYGRRGLAHRLSTLHYAGLAGVCTAPGCCAITIGARAAGGTHPGTDGVPHLSVFVRVARKIFVISISGDFFVRPSPV